MVFNIPIKDNEKLERIVRLVDENKELQTYLKCSNIMAIDRMGFSDHGYTHGKIVANIGLKMLRILIDHKVEPSIVKYYKLSKEDAEVVVVLGAVIHDLGMAVHRHNHEMSSVIIAFRLLNEMLDKVYEKEEKVVVISEALHTAVCHGRQIKPVTVEGGIVSIADALDMAGGRARIPFSVGKVNIHSVSAMAIEKVELGEGKEGEEPIQIKIKMANSAGIFQIDELLRKKVLDSGLKDYIRIIAEIEGEAEKKIIISKLEI